MSNLLNSSHFVRNTAVPVFSDLTPLSRVFEQLEASGVNGFVLETQGQPHTYVKANKLAQQMIQASAKEPAGLAAFGQQPIRELIASFPEAAVPAGRITADPSVNESDLQNQSDRVFAIIGPQGRIGWYFNHETLTATLTARPVYICKRQHRNTRWNNGRCSVCPAPLELVTP